MRTDRVRRWHVVFGATLFNATLFAISLRGFSLMGVSAAADLSPVVGPRERIAAMSAGEREVLRRNLERFRSLSAAERDRLRKLHQDLTADPNGEQLREVLERYSGWLKTLTPTQAAELVDLPREPRLAAIKSQLQQQAMVLVGPLAGSKLKPADVDAIVDWLDDFIQRHESQIRADLPREFALAFLEKVEDPKKKRLILYSWYMRRPLGEKAIRPSEDDLKQLQAQLSPDAQAELAKATDNQARSALFMGWLRLVVYSKTLPQVSREELQAFMSQRLSPQEKEYLESLPQERVWGELNKMYFKDKFDRSPGFGSGSFGNSSFGGPRFGGEGRGRPEGGTRGGERRRPKEGNGPPGPAEPPRDGRGDEPPPIPPKN